MAPALQSLRELISKFILNTLSYELTLTIKQFYSTMIG